MRPETERLRHEHALQRKLRRIVKDETVQLQTEMATGREALAEVLLIPNAQRRIARKVQRALLEARQSTKADVFRRDIPKLGLRDMHATLTDRDIRRAQRAGQKMAETFGLDAVGYVSHTRTAISAGTMGVTTNIGEVPTTLVTKANVTAITEITDAYTEGKYALSSMLGGTTAWRWNSILDRRTCAECGSLDGHEATFFTMPVGPPPVHPNCRCFLEVA